MATMLTQSYQWLADIHTWTDSYGCSYTARLYGRWISQDKNAATTQVQFKIEYAGNKTSSAYSINHTPTIELGNVVVVSRRSLGNQTNYANTTYKLAEATATVTHNQQTGAYSSSQYAYFHSSYYGGGEVSAAFSLPTIQRKATVTAATDFNDEGNPTVTFSNPGNFTTKPYLKFYDSSNTLVHTITGSDGVTSPYTWALTDAQRSSLRTATNKQTTYTVEEGIETFNGSTSLGTSSINKTFTITNATPTASHAIVESDAKVSAVLGTSGATIVKGISDIKVTVTPSYKKGATAKNISIKLGSTTSSSNPATFSNVTNGSLSYTVTDSRSNSVTKTATLNVVDYIPVSIDSCEFRRKATGSNIVVLNAVVTVNTGTIGGKTNTLTVGYSSSNNKSGTITTYTKGTNKITISNLELGTLVSDGEVAAFTLTVSDLFTSASATNNVIVPVPVLDAGVHDVQVNGTLYVASQTGENKVDILTTLNSVKTTANAAPKVFVQSAQPTATKKGDIWFKI